MVRTTDPHNGVPGAMACRSHRRAGPGSGPTIARSRGSGDWLLPASTSHSCRTRRAAAGTGGVLMSSSR
jgi:hypothetical protein